MKIYLKIVGKWLNCLEYKQKNIQKDVFFDRNKCEDVVEYQRIFIEQIKALLFYFVKFQEDDTILPKKYPKDCSVKGLDQ